MAIKGTGFDNSNIKNVTVVSGDILEIDGGMTVAETLDVTGSASIGGDLTVTGDIISRGTVDLIVQDNFIDLNAGNDSQTALASGFTFSLNRASGFTTATVTTFVAGVAATSNPTFTSTDAGSSSLVAAGDVVFITGAAEASNDGLYVVSSVDQASFPQVVTIKGVGTVATNGNTPWAQTQFTADTGDTASVYKVDLKVLAIADGTNFPDSGGTANTKGTVLEAFAAGATEGDFTSNGDYSALGAASGLQTAYNTDPTITTASSTDIAFTVSAAGGNFTVDGNGSVNFGGGTAIAAFDVTGSAATITASNNAADAIILDASNAAGTVTIQNANGDVAEFKNSSVEFFNRLNTGGSAGRLYRQTTTAADDFKIMLDTNSTGLVDASLILESEGSGTDALQIQTVTNGGSIDINSVAAVTIDSASASNFTVAGANLTLSTTTSGNIDVTAAGTFSIDGTGASNVTATSGNLTLSTATSGTLILSSAAGATLDSTTLSIDSTDTTNFTMTANAASEKVLLIRARNSDGSNDGNIDIDADIRIDFQLGGTSIAVVEDFTGVGGGTGILMQSGNGFIADTTGGFQFGAAASVTLTDALDEDDMASDSATAIATQQSIKAYVDSRGISDFGSVATLTADEAIAVGKVVAIKVTGGNEGRAILADADAASTANVVGICISAAAAQGDPCIVAQVGTMGGFSGLTAGNKLYASTTAGDLTASAPGGTGDVIFQVGFAISTTTIIIQPVYVMELG